MQQQREKKELKNFYSGLILETQKSLNTNIHTDSQSQGHSSSNVKDIAHTSIRVPIPDYYNDNKSTTRHPTPSPPKKEIDCGCPHVCDKQALNKRTAKLVCKKRIEFLMEKYNDTERKACAAASETTPFADTHLPCEMECHPEYCKDMTEKPKIEISRLEIPNPISFYDYALDARRDTRIASIGCSCKIDSGVGRTVAGGTFGKYELEGKRVSGEKKRIRICTIIWDIHGNLNSEPIIFGIMKP
eukprot:scaffold1698_cov279-Chaetoceros_neogracile.AAC.19